MKFAHKVPLPIENIKQNIDNNVRMHILALVCVRIHIKHENAMEKFLKLIDLDVTLFYRQVQM